MFHYQLHNPSLLYKAQNQHTILKKICWKSPNMNITLKLIKENAITTIIIEILGHTEVYKLKMM